jgi:hypothetical protein
LKSAQRIRVTLESLVEDPEAEVNGRKVGVDLFGGRERTERSIVVPAIKQCHSGVEMIVGGSVSELQDFKKLSGGLIVLPLLVIALAQVSM